MPPEHYDGEEMRLFKKKSQLNSALKCLSSLRSNDKDFTKFTLPNWNVFPVIKWKPGQHRLISRRIWRFQFIFQYKYDDYVDEST